MDEVAVVPNHIQSWLVIPTQGKKFRKYLLHNAPLCKNVVVVVVVVVVVAYITIKQIPGILGVPVVMIYIMIMIMIIIIIIIIISTFHENHCHLKGVIYHGPEHGSCYISVPYNVFTLRRFWSCCSAFNVHYFLEANYLLSRPRGRRSCNHEMLTDYLWRFPFSWWKFSFSELYVGFWTNIMTWS